MYDNNARQKCFTGIFDSNAWQQSTPDRNAWQQCSTGMLNNDSWHQCLLTTRDTGVGKHMLARIRGIDIWQHDSATNVSGNLTTRYNGNVWKQCKPWWLQIQMATHWQTHKQTKAQMQMWTHVQLALCMQLHWYECGHVLWAPTGIYNRHPMAPTIVVNTDPPKAKLSCESCCWIWARTKPERKCSCTSTFCLCSNRL